jgi:hypothetical protein
MATNGQLVTYEHSALGTHTLPALPPGFVYEHTLVHPCTTFFSDDDEESDGESGCVDDDDRAYGGRRRFSDAEESEDEESEQGEEEVPVSVPVPVEVQVKPHYSTYRIESWHWYQSTSPSHEHTIERYNASCESRAYLVEPHVMFLRDNVTELKGFYFYSNGFPIQHMADTDGYVDVRTGKKYANSQSFFEDIN